MRNRKIGIIALLLCFCLQLLPLRVQAASTTDAIEPIVPENLCSLTIAYCYGELAFADVPVRLYRVAEVSANFQYTRTPAFAGSGLVFNDVQTTGEWNVIRSTLEAYILAYHIQPDAVTATDSNGRACFENLKTGLYLAVVDPATQGQMQYHFDSALVSLPGLGQDGRWQYQVSVNAKPEALPPVEPDEETEFRVLKLWKGDEDRFDRPQSIEVEIFRNGVSHTTATLSAENNWSYTWSAKEDGATWTVVERNVPQGYTMTVEARGNAFVLTNVRDPGDPIIPPPQTGDTSNILLYVLLMALSGMGLMALGVAGKRKTV